MNIAEEKRLNLIQRYNELEQIIIPILGEKKSKILINHNFENCDNETIQKIIVNTLNKIGGMVSSGIFLIILLNYKDLIEYNDPIKVMTMAINTKREY